MIGFVEALCSGGDGQWVNNCVLECQRSWDVTCYGFFGDGVELETAEGGIVLGQAKGETFVTQRLAD